ncbi:MAG: UvrD-helicase domain-containing protein, partial [Firmicutes bacterium]|nr:UvrD-helicase domain-containing protein [Bacillota bacterium]
LTSDFDRRFAGKKAARGLMDFSDIEHMALRILKNGEVSAEYKKRFACAFIDEYQDSNMVQESLISRVCEPDRIFMVGDVKQSIYKFRLAEPELFLEKYKAMKAGQLTGRVIDLNANFRSKAGVIELVNRLFSKVMNAESCGIVYDEDAALIEGAPYKGPLIYRPRLYIAGPGEAPEEEELDEEIEDIRTAELEALQAARIISSYIGRPIRDTRTGAERPLKYRDMALLMPAVKNKGEIFYRCLAAAGIPVYLARTEGYFDTLEVGVFLNLLRVIDNGRNDVPLISVLHFPAFGFSSEDLAEIRIFSNHSEEGKKKRPYSEALRLYAREGRDEALRTRCSDFLSKVAAWRRDASYAPLGLFVWRLLSSSGILDCCSALPGGLQRQANLRALADKAESFERESASGLYGFISYVDSIKDKVDTGEAEIFTEDSDAVRIMTIHKSKGLEFPFVLVCGMERSFSRGGRASKLAVHKKLGAGLVLADPATGLRNKTLIYRLISMQNRSEERAEKIRLLYVAATRAKDILIFSAAGKNLEKSWAAMRQQVLEPGRYEKSFLGLLASAFTAESDVIFTKQSVLEDPSATGETGALRKALEQGFELSGGEAPIPDLDERLAFKPSSAEAGEKTKFTVSQLAEIERLGAEGILKEQSFDEDFRPPLFIAPASSLGAAERGTAYHRVMEHLPFDRGELDASEILEHMKNMEASGILSPAELAAVDPGRVAAFFRSPIGKRVLSSEKVMKEAPFTVKREYGGRTVLVQGTLDCCFMEDGSWVLVDYKSNYIDRASEEEEMERLRRTYLPQLSEYRYALKTVTGIPVKEAVLYLFGPGKELVIE